MQSGRTSRGEFCIRAGWMQHADRAAEGVRSAVRRAEAEVQGNIIVPSYSRQHLNAFWCSKPKLPRTWKAA